MIFLLHHVNELCYRIENLHANQNVKKKSGSWLEFVFIFGWFFFHLTVFFKIYNKVYL